MKNVQTIFLGIASVFIISSCSVGKKKEKTSECEGCPEPILIVVPSELKDNPNALLYITDAEAMFDKWSKRAYMLTKDIEELEQVDSTEMSFSESMKAGATALKMLGYMSEFMTESLEMNQRMEELKPSLSDKENEAFYKVMKQFEDRMEEISASLNKLGIDVPENNKEMVEALKDIEEK